MSSWELFLTNLKIKLFAWWTIPLLAISGAKIIALDKRSVKVRIKHWWLTKNHIGGIYLGTQAIGADITGGALVLNAMNESDKKVSVAFKSMQCEFLKRPESDMVFTCNDGDIIADAFFKHFKNVWSFWVDEVIVFYPIIFGKGTNDLKLFGRRVAVTF